MLIGYARVSTEEQSLDLQLDALHNSGCEDVYRDVISGSKAGRPGLENALSHLRAGFEACPDDLRTDAIRRIVRAAVSIAERCSDQLQLRDEKEQASDLAGWLDRSSRSRDHLVHPKRPALALQIGEERQGSVVRMTRERGFGFIRTDGQLDVFFHRSDLDDGRWWDEIREGTDVCFTVDQEPKGWRARQVRRA
ncbi:MAG: recombinase family protein [Ktedonobacterales bacterium]